MSATIPISPKEPNHSQQQRHREKPDSVALISCFVSCLEYISKTDAYTIFVHLHIGFYYIKHTKCTCYIYSEAVDNYSGSNIPSHIKATHQGLIHIFFKYLRLIFINLSSCRKSDYRFRTR